MLDIVIFNEQLQLIGDNYLFPSLDCSFSLCEFADELGLGQPQYYVVDSLDLPAGNFIGSVHGGFLYDYDLDGYDDMIIPLGYDLTGDGLQDFAYVLDMDCDGIPDISPDSIFYPVGSSEYEQLFSIYSDDLTVMDKDFDSYEPSEAFLFILVIISLLKFLLGLFRPRNVF